MAELCASLWILAHIPHPLVALQALGMVCRFEPGNARSGGRIRAVAVLAGREIVGHGALEGRSIEGVAVLAGKRPAVAMLMMAGAAITC